jgi:plastocyanin
MSHLRRPIVAFLAFCGGLAAGSAGAATADVTLTATPDNLFLPQVVTIRVGDTVRWTNVEGGHNVQADDGSFTSGAAAPAPWVFEHTFAAAGSFGYFCIVHGFPAGGMFGTVVVLPDVEMVHGSDRVDDLAGAPDSFRLGQKAYSSYEAVVESLAGDPTLRVDRVDSAGSLIQAGQAVTATIDMAQSLRWENATAGSVDSERVRVGSTACPAACSGNDVYRIRLYETSLAIPRYNNSGSQVSVVVLQNPTDYPINGHVYFWSGAGVLVNAGGAAFSLPAKNAVLLSGASVPGVAGTAGTVTVSHDGRYGDLAGKVVALEPSTGFSFDTPALVRPR